MKAKKKLTILAFIILLLLSLKAQPVRATDYYVSPEDDLQSAINNLSPGDTLYLNEGTYYQSGLSINAQGSSAAPITIKSAPGGRAIIDGGIPDFRDVPNNKWELVNGSIHLYRSIDTYPSNAYGAWLLDYDTQIIEYDRTDCMESTNYNISPSNPQAAVYQGPGLQRRSDGHLYIRLELGPHDRYTLDGDPINFPTNPNPNNLSLAVYTHNRLVYLNGATHLILKDLDFVRGSPVIEMSSTTNNIELDGLNIKQGRYGIMVYGSSNCEIHNCEVNGGLPDYLYWTDLKDSTDPSEAGPEFADFGILGVMHDFDIHHNTIHHIIDGGMTIAHTSSDVKVRNNIFREIRDDAINFSTDIRNVEISYNMFWHVLAGLALNGDDGNYGHVYIHHNVIDNSRYQRGGRPNFPKSDWPQWTTGSIFSGHPGGGNGWWKIYNNTIIAKSNGYGNPAGPASIGDNSEKYVYNNLLVVLDDMPILTGSSPAHYGGNIVWEIGGSPNTDLGEIIDPGLDADTISNTNFDPNTIWERYRPTNQQIFTPGTYYTGLNWPGIDGVDYRGALGPSDPTLPRCFSSDDSHIGSDDIEVWAQDYAQLGSSLDVNGDDKINTFEFAYLHLNWGLECEST